jgi:hypothetical protein
MARTLVDEDGVGQRILVLRLPRFVGIVELTEGVLPRLVILDLEQILPDEFDHGLILQDHVVPKFCFLEVFFEFGYGKLVKLDNRVVMKRVLILESALHERQKQALDALIAEQLLQRLPFLAQQRLQDVDQDVADDGLELHLLLVTAVSPRKVLPTADDHRQNLHV